MTKTTAYRAVLWTLTLAWAGTIVFLSLQSGTQSSAFSSGLTAWVLRLFPAYRDLSFEEQLHVLETVQSAVRELAHIAEYTLLSLLAGALAHSYRKHRFGLTAGVPLVLFSVVDECLQEFVSQNRAFQLIDLLKDWLGCVLGLGCIWLVYDMQKRKHYQKDVNT